MASLGAVMAAAKAEYDGSTPTRAADFAAAIVDRVDPVRPSLDSCLTDVIDIFELRLPDSVSVPVLLVDDVHPTGGITNGDLDDHPVSIIGLSQHSGHELAEAIVHEVTHGLLTIDQSSVRPLMELLHAAPPARHQLWHVPIFLTAAELIRRHADALHVDYGTAHDYYARSPVDCEIAARWWPRRLNGELDLAAVCAGMLADAS